MFIFSNKKKCRTIIAHTSNLALDWSLIWP